MIQYRKYKKDNRIGRIASGRMDRINGKCKQHGVIFLTLSTREHRDHFVNF